MQNLLVRGHSTLRSQFFSCGCEVGEATDRRSRATWSSGSSMTLCKEVRCASCDLGLDGDKWLLPLLCSWAGFSHEGKAGLDQLFRASGSTRRAVGSRSAWHLLLHRAVLRLDCSPTGIIKMGCVFDVPPSFPLFSLLIPLLSLLLRAPTHILLSCRSGIPVCGKVLYT